jgi:hypothetical protein
MRQKRSRRLADRPPSFRAESGKEILVQQDVAARNDKTTKRGRVVAFHFVSSLAYAAHPSSSTRSLNLSFDRRKSKLSSQVQRSTGLFGESRELDREPANVGSLVNFLSSLASLGAEGRAVRVRRIVAIESLNLYIQREIPVFGIVDGVVVIGIIVSESLIVTVNPLTRPGRTASQRPTWS